MEIADGKDYLDQVSQRIAEYAARLGRDLSFQNIEEELENPAQKYTAPEGELLVAVEGNRRVVGMVAYHRLSAERCEMKRLYVAPECRGMQIGEQLVQAVVEHAQRAGFAEMVLDTIAPLQTAIHLYQKFGFAQCEAYYCNPMDDVIYMKKIL